MTPHLPSLSSGAVDFSCTAAAAAHPLIERMAAAWAEGRRLPAESFLDGLLGPDADPEVAVRVIYEEVCLREGTNRPATPDELFRRFPRWRAELGVLLECHQALGPQPGPPKFPLPGESLDAFQLIAVLGQGALGRVYLASQPDLAHRRVVLKVTPIQGSEHHALARLQHPNIVPLLSVHERPDLGLRILCMPYHGGTTLQHLLNALTSIPASCRTGADLALVLDRAQNPHSSQTPYAPAKRFLASESYPRAVAWIALGLAEALHSAHRLGLVHLDVKASNVLIAADGIPMLLDFHLARPPLAQGDPPPRQFGGTRLIMPPEQVRAMEAVRAGLPIPGPVDARADIFALGSLLGQALLGSVTPSPIPHNARRLRDHNPQLTSDLAALVARCLDPDPSLRYASAADLASDLRRFLDHRPLQGVASRGLRERWARYRRRHPHALSRIAAWSAVPIAACVALLALASADSQRVAHARDAHLHGCRRLDAGDPREATLAFEDARRRLDAAGPFAPLLANPADLRLAIRHDLARAHRAGLVRDLHDLAERLRPHLAGPPPDPTSARALAPRLDAFWSRRVEIADALNNNDAPDARDHLLADLLDLGLLRVALRAPDRAAALLALDEVQALSGPCAVVDHERKALLGRHAPRNEPNPAPDPTTAWGWLALGRAQFRDGLLAPAADSLDRAVALQPQGLWPHFERGRCALRLGRPAQALDAFATCVALAPSSAPSHYNRALAYHALGEPDRALLDIQAARALDPDARFPDPLQPIPRLAGRP